METSDSSTAFFYMVRENSLKYMTYYYNIILFKSCGLSCFYRPMKVYRPQTSSSVDIYHWVDKNMY